MSQSREDLIGMLSTLVSSLDELPEQFECIPEISDILNYINTACRTVVNENSSRV